MAGALPEFAIPQTLGSQPTGGITKAEILAFVNRVLHREETDIDAELRLLVDDLADLHCLRAVQATQTLTSTSDHLAYPSDALCTEAAILSLQLRSPAGVWDAPLKPWAAGWPDHCRFYEGNPSRSTPERYATQEVLGEWRIYIDPRPASDRVAWIHYYRRHGAIGTNLEFPDDWRRAVYFGAAMEVAATYGLANGVALWGARYNQEKEKRRILMPSEPAIMEF